MTSTSISAGVDGAGQAEIATITVRMVTAWRAHDADAFAELFIEDGTLILPGVLRQGRAAIREFMAAAYEGPYKGTTVTGQPIEIKPLAPGAVALLTEGGVIAAGSEKLADRDAIRASWIVVKRDGKWSLAVYQNCPRDPS